MSGHLVFVVGPSGVGKDSLISAAMRHFTGDTGLFFPRRIITRVALALAEDHDTLSKEQFEMAETSGAFFLRWHAHGLSYGLPMSVKAELEKGHVVVANVSRSILGRAAEIWPKITVFNITARPEILAQRLASRAREDDGNLSERLDRKVPGIPVSLSLITIDNNSTLAEAGALFCSKLEKIKQRAV